jgi:beta-lactam-binding protein with PASTA domain
VKLGKGNAVTLLVSTGKPKTTVPKVVGSSSTDAVAALVAAHLQANLVQVGSDKPAGTVTATDPKGGSKVDQGTTVRVNVAKGPQQFAVPSVVGEQFDQANSDLQNAGFIVLRKDVKSKEPANTVIDQSPPGGSAQPKGSTITLTVSKGPPTSPVPDVTGQDKDSASSTLKASGFRVQVHMQDTSDPAQDGIVLSQDPSAQSQQPAKTVVSIVVGHFVGATTETTTTTDTNTVTSPTP